MSGISPAPAPAPALHTSNVLGSPGSTWAGAAAIFGVVTAAMGGGFPTTQAGWITFGVALATGVGAIFSRA